MKKITLLLLLLLVSVSGYSQLYGLTEGFENMPSPAGPLPATWTSPISGNWAIFERNNPANVGSGQSWGINAFAAGLQYQGNDCASVNREQINAGSTSEDFLATSVISVPATGVTELHFWTRLFASGDQGTIFKVMVAPAFDTAAQADPNSYSEFVQWSELDLITPTTNFNVWTEKTVNLSAYAGFDIYVAFVRVYTQPTATQDGDRWLIDNVGVYAQCVPPVTGTTTGITSNSAVLTWTPANGATSWEIELVPAANAFTGTVTYTHNGPPPFTIPVGDLSPNTTYKYQIRGICSTGFTSDWSAVSANFTTQVAPPVCGGNLVDSGGIGGNYSNNENISTTVTPNPGEVVTVTFTAFNTQAATDFLKIYDGPSTASPLIANLSGATLPPSFTSTATNGELTFVFTSNGTTVASGYAANITCGPAPACRIPTSVLSSLITTTSVTLNWTQPANPDTSVASTWDVIALPAGSLAPTASSTPTANDITSGGPTPSYLLSGLTSATCYDIYVRAVCGATNSGWSLVATSICTLVAPPECGGNFVDTGGTTGNYGNNANLTTTICPVNVGVDAVSITFTAFNIAAGDALAVYDGDNNTATLLATLTGTTLPPSFISSAPSGCLTFVFTSNTTGTAEGWLANVTCAPKPTCSAPTVIGSNTVTHNTAIITWVQPANPDNSTPNTWDIITLPCGSPRPTATSVPTVNDTTLASPHTLTGLTPLTCYDVYVRASCDSSWSGPTTFTTLAAPPECGGNFVDAGGTTGAYALNSNITTIICPTTPGDVVTVTFTSFNTEGNFDALYVYNGNAVVPGNLIPSTNPAGSVPGGLAGGYWGTTVPCPFTSAASNGCLTFVFRSDGSVQNAGWVANITCGPPPTCNIPSAVTTNTVTSTSVILNWTQPANADSSVASTWDIIALPCGSLPPTATSTPTVNDLAIAPPYTLTGLTSATCYNIYIRAVCGTENSAWICTPATITTQVAPPECDGNFVDAAGPAANYANSSDSTVTICPDDIGDAVTVTFTIFNTETNFDGLLVYDGDSTASPQIPSANGTGFGPLATITGAYWGNLTGANIPGPFTSSSSTGCLTFRFLSDASFNNPGWVANVTCAPAPECQKPNTLTATQITSTSAYLGWTEPSGNVTQWQVLVLPFGSAAPLPDATGWVTVSTNPALFTGLNPGTRYTFYVRSVCPTSGTSAWSTGGNFNTLIINDNCDGALFAPVNSDAVCEQIVSGTIAGATASIAPDIIAPCVGTADDDVWFQFIATNSYLNVSIQSVVGSTTNLNFAAYSGNCGTLTQIFCSAANTLSGVLNGLTVGNTYYIRIYSNAATPQTSTFNLCISTPSTCTNSSSVCSTVGLSYGNTTGVTSLGTIGCLFSSPNPTFFTIQVVNNGPINYLLTQSTTPGGTPNLDVDYAAWGPFNTQAEVCAAIGSGQAPLTGLTTGCSFSAAPTENFNIPSAVAGQFYVILITNFSDDPGYISLTQTNVGAPGAGLTLCCPDADFSYASSTYCKDPSVPNPIPTIDTGSLAGVFSLLPSTPTGLVFANTATGEIDLQASAPGNYVVLNTLAATSTCAEKTYTFTVSIVAPATATIAYDAPYYCQSVTTLQNVTQTGTAGGTYSAEPNGGLFINATTGAINPSLSSPGIYTVTYSLPGSSVCIGANPSFQVEIAPLPNIVQPEPVQACNTYTLPVLAVGNYFDGPGGTGNQLAAGDVISTLGTQTIYIYAVSNLGCINEKSFTVTINTVTTPTFTTTLSSCATSTGTITVTSPIGTAPLPTNLFISEVTDAATGSLTYVEIFNGTGAAVNLSNYKLRTFNNGSSTFTAGCDNILSGTLNNNSTHVISVGSTTNVGGVIPNQVFSGCSGVNNDDCIKLMTNTNTEIDLWGRTDGISFTPLNQTGYTYRRNNTAVAPSTTWNPANWTALDPEDYTNVGSYSSLNSNYEYSIDNGTTFQTSTLFSNLAPGNYTLLVRDSITGCLSEPVPVFIDAVGSIPSVTTFTYTTPVCQNATVNPLPDTSATGFTTGGVFTSNPSTGIDINPTTGEINLASTVAGSYDITYTFAFNPNTCQLFSSTTFTIVITNVITPVLGFSYTTPICQDAQATLTPTLVTGFTTGGVFSSTTGLIIDSTTGVIDLASSTVGSYTISYTIAGNSCQSESVATFDIVINPVITPVTTFTYTTPICQTATVNPLPDTSITGFTTGGVFTSNPSTGIDINPSTGEINLATTTPGTYDISYTVAAAPATCQLLSSTTFTVVITNVITPIIGFSYTTPICQNAQATLTPTLVAGFMTGGVFSSTTGLIVDSTTGVIDLSASVAGPYTITYTLAGNSCQNESVATFDIVINPVITPVTTFTYTTPVCQIATSNPLPDTSAIGFTTGGIFTSNPVTGIDINAATGEINLANTVAGTYLITYEVAANASTCQVTNSTSFTIVITPTTPAEVGFSYTSPICQIAQPTLSPVLATGFVTGGTFAISPSTGVTIDPSTGELTLGSTATAGTYSVTYTIAENPSTCQALTTSTSVQVVITPTTPAEVGFSYTSPICQIAQPTLSPVLATGFVTGGTFAISPSTGVTINPSTGELTLGSTATAGTYSVTYTVAENPSTCQALTISTSVQVVITPTTPAEVGFSYTSPICQIAQPTLSPVLATGFVTGGTFAISPSTGVTINPSTGELTLGSTATAGTYSVTYTVAENPSTCQALTTSASVQVIISAPTAPIVGFQYVSPVCAGDTVNPMPVLDSGFVSGGVFGPSNLVDPITGEFDLSAATAGQQYTITYDLPINTGACQNANSSSATITISPPIVIELNGGCQNVYVLNATPVNGSFNPETATFQWNNAQGPVSGGDSQSLIVPSTGFYTVTITVDGCQTVSAPFEVTSIACQIQRGISVNNDGFNDTFDLTGFDVKQLTIFNRLGMKVYSRANYVNEWGGKSDDGDELPDGTYFYVIDQNAGGTKTGWIYINRAQ